MAENVSQAVAPRYDLCTLFDRRYLARALVLFRSLAEHGENVRIWAFCMDEESQHALQALSPRNVETVSLGELEDYEPRLHAAKQGRTRVEYYWTLTPVTCLYVLDRDPDSRLAIRADADLCFYNDPSLALAELGSGSVMLTPHRFAPEFELSDSSEPWGGIFNVVFEAFRRDENGLAALNWWHERCLEWCYDRWEPGRYGDQEYLDQFPHRFNGVVAGTNPGAGLAPWNVGRHHLQPGADGLRVDSQPLIFHHFQSLEVHPAESGRIARHTDAYRFTAGPRPLVWTTGWRLTERELELLWDPYVRRLSTAFADLREVAGTAAEPDPVQLSRVAFHAARRRLPRRVKNAYWRARDVGWRLRYRYITAPIRGLRR